MLTAQPSTYDMFALIELYGRKVQSDCVIFLKNGERLLKNIFFLSKDCSSRLSWNQLYHVQEDQ